MGFSIRRQRSRQHSSIGAETETDLQVMQPLRTLGLLVRLALERDEILLESMSKPSEITET